MVRMFYSDEWNDEESFGEPYLHYGNYVGWFYLCEIWISHGGPLFSSTTGRQKPVSFREVRLRCLSSLPCFSHGGNRLLP